MGLVDNSKNHTLLQTKLAELGHPNSQFKFIKAEAPAGRSPMVESATAAPAAQAESPRKAARAAAKSPTSGADRKSPVPFKKDDFKNDPLIQKALEVFKGQIVEVRA